MGNHHSVHSRNQHSPSPWGETADGHDSESDDDGLKASLLALLFQSPSTDMAARARSIFYDFSELSADERQLYGAITSGDEPKVRELLSRGVGRLHEEHELYPLIVAAMGGHLSIAQMLLVAGARVDVRDSKLWTPLHHACHQGHAEVVRALLSDAPACTEAKDNVGCTPLLVCCIMGTNEAAAELLRSSADPDAADNDGFTAVQSAVNGDNLELVHLLLQFKADPNPPNVHGDTALHLACSKGDEDASIVNLLLEHGAEPNAARPSDGLTPIYMAVLRGHEAKVESLLSKGADPNWSRAEHGITPLGAAAINQQHSVTPRTINLLLQHDANPNIPDDRGRTPLMSAIVSKFHEAVQILIAAGADVNAQEKSSGMRPLHFAVMRDQIQDVQALLAAHADPNAADPNTGATPLHAAAMRGTESCAKALIDAGADVKSTMQAEGVRQTPLLSNLILGERSQNATAVLARAVAYRESQAWPSEIPNIPNTSVFGRWPGKLPSSLSVFPTAMPVCTDEQTPPWEHFGERMTFEAPSFESRGAGQDRSVGGGGPAEEEPRVTSNFFRDVNNNWSTEQLRLTAELLEKMAPDGYDVSGLRRSLLNSAVLTEGLRSARGEDDVEKLFNAALSSLEKTSDSE
ncbi:ankyrin repeat-containing domain protein [Rhypophila decipiens]|uniref:Ankyrin repeat-containing domain protein n=1 Tax=Rhypophila decipiens TaxID=261697 RepID=A0AAN7B521_9PEZI|nr:ankyrin repeat-containing domain protein [Rhypophila decipiens]